MATKLTGIIYRAYNTVSGKSYVGKSVQPLRNRIQQHYYAAKKANHKFANALKYYPKNVWKWEVLSEVEIEKLDEYELFFISDLDTFSKGYNSVLEAYDLTKVRKPQYDSTKIYELYHSDYGDIVATRDELRNLNPTLVKRLSELESGKYKSYLSFVLAINKDKYEELVTSKNKEVVYVLTLMHPELGTYTLTRDEFHKQLGISRQDLSRLALKQRHSCKGWRLADANTSTANSK